MRLTLHVPGLLLPRTVLIDTVFDLTAPALSLQLGRARRHSVPPEWLTAAFGLAALPAAALRRTAGSGEMAPEVGAGKTATNPEAGDWLCLDPVHLQVTREGISLADPAQLELAADEAAALRDALQPLFADWGDVSASAPQHWELRLNRPLALATLPLADAVGRPVDPALPGGADGKAWRRLLAEAQTMLHAHPVNRQRDALGRPTVNSLWPWGPGALTETPHTRFNAVWSANPVIAGLCVRAGIPCLPPPNTFQPARGNTLAIIDSLARPAATLDALAWRESLQALERDWLAPALLALKQGACRELQLVGTQPNASLPAAALTMDRGTLRHFWRRPRPVVALTELVTQATSA